MKKISILLLLSSLAIFGCGKDASINDIKGEAKPIEDSKLSAVENAPKSSAAAAPVKEVGKLNVLLDEDFEGDTSKFTKLVGKGNPLKFVSGGEAISGKKSLCLDSMGSTNEWILAAELNKSMRFKPGNVYVVEFKYNLLKSLNQSSDNYVSMVGDKGEFYGRYIFASAPGQKGNVKLYFMIPSDSNGAAFRFSSRWGCKTIIDDLKITHAEGINADSWITKSDAFIGMRKTPINQNMFDIKNPSYYLPKDKYFPMVDELGQFKHVEW